MLKYTKASINILLDDCKRLAKLFKYLSLISTVILLVYKIITKFINYTPVVFVHIALLAFALAFIVCDIFIDSKKHSFAMKTIKRVYSGIKIVLNAFILSVAIYDIAVTPGSETDGVAIILCAFMILLWLISIILQIVLEVVTQRCEMILVAFQQDIDDIKRPFTAVSDTFKKLTGQKVKDRSLPEDKYQILVDLEKRIEQDKLKDEESDKD